jgi:hypothetical protein
MKQILELTALSCNALANEAEEHLNEIVKAYYKSIGMKVINWCLRSESQGNQQERKPTSLKLRKKGN